MSQIQCPKCRNVIEPNDKFCLHCGEYLEKSAVKNEQSKACSKCGEMNSLEATFCEHCGSKLLTEQTNQKPKNPQPHKIVSKGSYSGKMNTGKSKLLKRLIIAAIIVVVVAVLAIVIWFQVDDNAEEKLKEAIRIPGTIVIIGFAVYVAIFGKSKKGRSRGGYDDDDYDDDYDDGGDDGDDD